MYDGALYAWRIGLLLMFATGVRCTSYYVHFASPAFASMPSVLSASQDEEQRPTVLPPVQCGSASEEMESSKVVGGLPSCDDDDDSVPPVVRFKNRYRRAQQQQLQQRYETVRDWNDNETEKMCSPVDDDHAAGDTKYSASPAKILPDPDAVRYNLEDRRTSTAETRPREKRTWLSRAAEVDLADPSWMSSNKIPCRDATVDSRRTDAGHQSKQPENKLPKQYQQIHHRGLEYQNCFVNCTEPKCELIRRYYCFLLHICIFINLTSFVLIGFFAVFNTTVNSDIVT